MTQKADDWYKDAIIYELHVKAFCDGNGDGIGDFTGLLQKIDYLKDLGVDVIWLLPFYPSPLRDDGYDIADYYNINPSYGDIETFKKFLHECHLRNMKVITELVINHTSDQHGWFQLARKSPKGSAERNYYVWTDDPAKYRDARIIFQDFELSNWTWDPVAEQYYWHRFFHHQPDLNFENKKVQNEILKIISFWCKLGVDGFRLDAVPYLFERDDTNCENLPETHAFLKALRKYVDEKFPGTMLLAEANMWPDDAVSYFGEGDECHMNFNFPVMPRIFMSLQMEDRYPITEILEQMPAIPDSCQWAIFLRNHDELTLEMVTDEERDYMYKMYVKDPQAKINLGIRHRLAPLMGNDRKKIELLNCLLFSFPGTPVLYYGDEIGMGDNFYLGDRNGVRTPMQWSSDRNAGFSSANPQKLYLPVIIDPQYHYETINVDIQSQNRFSLLWWTKRIIKTRKKLRALSRGNLRFINSDNPKVLSFVRSFEDETVLVVANLSRFSQPSQLRLEDYKGFLPIEIFSKNRYPHIKEEPYFFTLGAYECQWFVLENENKEIVEDDYMPLLKAKSWKDLFSDGNIEIFESVILSKYISKMRWFGGKAKKNQSICLLNIVPLKNEQYSPVICLIRIIYESGLPEMYQLPLAFETGERADNIIQRHPKSVICKMETTGMAGIIYDAVYSSDFMETILSRMAASNKNTSERNGINYCGNIRLSEYLNETDRIRSNILSAEQSNTSINYDNKFFLKIYRKVDYVLNPDVEVTRALSEDAKFPNVPAYSGSYELKDKEGSITLGMMQEFVPDSTDAWSAMLDHLGNYNEKILSMTRNSISFPKKGFDLLNPVKYEMIHEDLKQILDVSIAERIRLLGKRTAEMHIALSTINEREFKPEAFSLHYQRSLFFSIQSLVRRTFSTYAVNVDKLPENLKEEAVQLLQLQPVINTILKGIYEHKFDTVKTRIHGDYHLGQILFTGKDLMILDFEGEPSSSHSERRLKRSPLRDVAGMVRSLHYAAYGSIFLNNHFSREDIMRLGPFSDLWYHYMSGFFMDAYLKAAAGHSFIPSKKSDLKIMLQTYLIEKSIYELNYELNNRPGWVIIPMKGIKEVIGLTEETNG
jgi:maltose alpha-D-glucosyltransferase/alpha-amylase